MWFLCHPGLACISIIFNDYQRDKVNNIHDRSNPEHSTNCDKVSLKYICHGAYISGIISSENFFYLVADTLLKRIIRGKDTKQIGMIVVRFLKATLAILLMDSAL